MRDCRQCIHWTPGVILGNRPSSCATAQHCLPANGRRGATGSHGSGQSGRMCLAAMTHTHTHTWQGSLALGLQLVQLNRRDSYGRRAGPCCPTAGCSSPAARQVGNPCRPGREQGRHAHSPDSRDLTRQVVCMPQTGRRVFHGQICGPVPTCCATDSQAHLLRHKLTSPPVRTHSLAHLLEHRGQPPGRRGRHCSPGPIPIRMLGPRGAGQLLLDLVCHPILGCLTLDGDACKPTLRVRLRALSWRPEG